MGYLREFLGSREKVPIMPLPFLYQVSSAASLRDWELPGCLKLIR